MIADRLRQVALRKGRDSLAGLTLYRTDKGWQANARFKDRGGWTVETDADPVTALLNALGAERPSPQPSPELPSIFD